MRIKQLEESLFERNDELDKVRKQLREEKQKNLDIEKHWRAQLESERQDADIKYDGQVYMFVLLRYNEILIWARRTKSITTARKSIFFT